jgi:hypothetical protein
MTIYIIFCGQTKNILHIRAHSKPTTVTCGQRTMKTLSVDMGVKYVSMSDILFCAPLCYLTG